MRATISMAAFFALAGAAAAGAGEFLVDGAWLEARIGRPDLVILHAEKEPGSYAAGHVPGARRVRWKDIAWKRMGLPNELPPFGRRRAMVQEWGLPDEGPIVVYDDGIGVAAGRVVLLLDSLEMAGRVRVLDGQLAAWKAEARPLSKVAADFEPSEISPGQNPLVVARAPEVKRLQQAGALLVDARPKVQYTGEEAGGGVKRPGHIPGARSVPAKTLLAPGEVPRLLGPAELREKLGLDRASGKPVITYCRTGGAAAVHYLALRSLEVPTRYYDGSFIDWSRREEYPVE